MGWQRRVVQFAFALSGFSALALQIIWQRLISVHSGVDLATSTTVVAAFMAGLGLGSALGGVIGRKVSARRAVQIYGLATLGVALFALGSVSWLYGGPERFGLHTDSAATAFAFHFVLLVVPTTLMGLSLPLLTRGVLAHMDDAAAVVGRLSAINTFGAAAGAFVTTWLLIGNFGFQSTVWILAGLDAAAAVAVLIAFRNAGNQVEVVAEPAAQTPSPWGWYALFALTGTIALGFEIVFFRVVDAIMRSNSYTFGHVLTLYLVLYAAGAAAGSIWVKRSTAPGTSFLIAQLALALSALVGFWALTHMPETFGMRRLLEDYFSTDGYLAGPEMPTNGRTAMRFVFAHLTGPLLIMGAPVFFMGCSFPLIMGAVQRSGDAVSTRVAGLQVANIAGNVAGSLLVGFVVLDAVGTMGAVRLLSFVLVVLCVALPLRLAGRRRVFAAVAVAGAFALLIAVPNNLRLWSVLHATDEAKFSLQEERSCVNTWVKQPDGSGVLFINATSQNGWPFDDFHVLIGLLPSLLQEAPERTLAIGLGAGSTAWGMLQDQRLSHVRCVELCGGQIELLANVGRQGSAELAQLMADPRAHLEVADGRRVLTRDETKWSVISVDALRPNSAYSGSVYSLEFYRLVRDRLAPGGIFSQWIPTERVLNGVRLEFPYVVTLDIPGGRGQFLMASQTPIVFDRAAVRARFAPAAQNFTAEQRARLESLIDSVPLVQARNGEPPPTLASDSFNSDLFPRDEYFLNDG